MDLQIFSRAWELERIPMYFLMSWLVSMMSLQKAASYEWRSKVSQKSLLLYLFLSMNVSYICISGGESSPDERTTCGCLSRTAGSSHTKEAVGQWCHPTAVGDVLSLQLAKPNPEIVRFGSFQSHLEEIQKIVPTCMTAWLSCWSSDL